MRWNFICIICKIPVYKNGPIPEIGKVWLPLWDEFLYSLSVNFQYIWMTLALNSEKCGCLYEMKFYIHYLQNFGIQEWPCPWNRKSVVASMRWNFICIICKILVYKSDPELEVEKMWLSLSISLFIICKIGVFEPYIRVTLAL